MCLCPAKGGLSPLGGSSPNRHPLSCAVKAQVGKCKTWSDDSMKAALKAVEDGQSVSRATRDYGIPKMTLFDRVSGRVINAWTKAVP